MKKTLIILPLFIFSIFVSYNVGVKKATKSNEEFRKQIEESGLDRKVNNETSDDDEDKFPPLNMPLEYFDAKERNPPRYTQKDYDLILDTPSYRSYPTTTISLKPEMYSSTATAPPPIKSDSEIHTSNPDLDFRGGAKQNNIAKYGDLARRFVGEAGELDVIDDVRYADVDNDGSKETLLSLSITGANILDQWDVVVKGSKVIFSTQQGSFSTLTPAKNGNGFFLQWIDDPWSRDGHTTTRFIFDDERFIPVYEQQTKYVRIKNN